MKLFDAVMKRVAMKEIKNINWIRPVLLLVIIVAISLSAGGCTFNSEDYHGEYPELYSIAINSVLGAKGYILSERKVDAKLTVLEKDEYGRTMFVYSEDNDISAYSLIISQKSDGKYVYFYPDYNFISAPKNSFSTEAVAGLKQANDWGNEIDLNKCVKVEIVRQKMAGPITDRQLSDLYFKAFGEDSGNYRASTFFITDDYGRSIYLGYGWHEQKGQTDDGTTIYKTLLFNPNGSYDESKCIMELSDIHNYQDALKAFKMQNGWNMPVA